MTRGEVAVRWLDRLLLAELVALTFLLGCFLDRDMDIWWHLRAGREILGGGGIPRVDSYLFATAGAEWIDLHWLFQTAAAWIFNRGGFAAVTLATAIAAAVGVAIGLAGTVRDRSVVAIVWCWLPAVFVMSARFFPRPEIVSLVCLAAFFYVLQSADREPWRLWLLVPIQLLWVNVQGLFVLGVIVLGCWIVDRALQGAMSRDRQGWRHLWIAPIAVMMACFANPYTLKGVLFPLILFRRMSTERGFYGRHIGELMSVPDLVWQTGISSVYLRLSLVLLVATAASFALRRLRFPFLYFRLLAFLIFAALGLLAIRNQPQFALAAGVVLAWNVGDWLAPRRTSPLVERAVTRILTSAVLVGLMLWVATGGFYAYAAEGRIAGLGEHPYWYAHDAATFAARPDMPRHFVAYHEGQAAVLEFHMRPDQRVFIDPRLEVSPRNALEQYYELATAMARRQSTWADDLRRLPQPVGLLVDHATHHVVEAALLADGGWRPVWFDAVAGVYVPSSEDRLVEQALDFGARYFAAARQTERATSTSDTSGTVLGRLSEAEGLFKVGRDLLEADPAARRLGRVLMLLGAVDARAVMTDMPRSLRVAQLLASTSVNVYGYPDAKTPAGDWQPEMILGLARGRYVLNRALERAPIDFESALTLFGIAQAFGDPDALWMTGRRLADLRARTASEYEVQRQVRVMLRSLLAARAAEPPPRLPASAEEMMTSVRQLVDQRRFLRALDVLERSLRDGIAPTPPPWELADLRARLVLAAGDPVRARAIWSESETTADHRAAIARGLANTHFVEGRLSEAADSYRAALAIDPRQPAARYGLAITSLERGDATGFVTECGTALQSPDLPPRLAEFCGEMSMFVGRYAGETSHRPSVEASGRADSR